MTNELLKDCISARFPDATWEEGQFLNLIISPEHLRELMLWLRSDSELHMDYLFCLSAVDYTDVFSVVYHLTSRVHRHTLVVKARISDRENPSVSTVCDIWRTAEFHEREAYDLMGISFVNHPDLRRMFLDDSWGFPLRKDYTDHTNIVAL